MKRQNLRRLVSFVTGVLMLADPAVILAKGYSSGGHSYSSHSSSGSSHSFSSGGSHSFSSGSTRSSSSSSGQSSHSSSSGTRSFSSGGGKSYSSGSSAPGDRKGYSSGKSYSSGGGSTSFYTGGNKSSETSSTKPSKTTSSSSGSSGFTYDTSAARARKEESSRSDFSKHNASQKPPVISHNSGGDYSGRPPPISRTTRSYTRTVYVPDYAVIRTRPSRVSFYFGSYGYRPWVYYNDSYSSLFWWWLLDRSIDEQAYWAYHHRYDMDPARYDSLMASNQQLQQRVTQLESQQVARDPAYTPPSLDQTNRDLMYSDQYVNQSYQTRSTPSGRAAFWVFAVPACAGFCALSIWLIWFKRWQVAT